MAYNIAQDQTSVPVQSDISSWISDYKEAFIEHSHDQSQLSLVTPDDSLIVVGPPRLSQAGGSAAFYIVGLVNGFNYSEGAQVQPFKAIGSRRHIFSRTNRPVQGNIQRMMVLGNNLLRALYAVTNPSSPVMSNNQKFAVGHPNSQAMTSQWFLNLEEDLYRYPFGLGVIYNSPASLMDSSPSSAGAEYIEVCTLSDRQVASQSGQAMIMENVTFMADRVVPWDAYSGDAFDNNAFTNDVGKWMG